MKEAKCINEDEGGEGKMHEGGCAKEFFSLTCRLASRNFIICRLTYSQTVFRDFFIWSAWKVLVKLSGGWNSATYTWNKQFARGALWNKWSGKLLKSTGKHKKQSSGGVL